jgi:SAM-dependent methyltransferase
MMNIRAHYNEKADPLGARNMSAALRSRDTGPLSPLKRHHNNAKRCLIDNFLRSCQPSKVLDLACGRGGDILKMYHAGVRHYVGLDISEASVEEARARAGNVLPSHIQPGYHFQQADIRDGLMGGGEGYDAVACFFALHYVVPSLEAVMASVAAKLKPRGVFFGIVPDGRRVLQEAHDKPRSDVLELKLLDGNSYSFALLDTVADGAVEYVCLGEHVRQAAHSAGLVPVPLGDCSAFFDESGHMRPPHKGGYTPSMERVTRLYAGFAFAKRS